MASVEEGLKTFIETQVSEAGKGYPMQVPQKASTPAFAYEVTRNDATTAHSGRVVMRKANILVQVHCATYAAASEARKAMQDALDGYKGDLGGCQAQRVQTSVADNWAENQQLPVARLDVTILFRP